jgi:PAS domain S-box-containing protein
MMPSRAAADVTRCQIEWHAVSLKLPPQTNELGGCFCISNPNLPDNPLTYVSPKFLDYTGFAASDIIGRNCRFLKGPETSAAVSSQLAEHISNKKIIEAIIVNRKADGTLFANHLFIQPLLNKSGTLMRFLGVQTPLHSISRFQDILTVRDCDVADLTSGLASQHPLLCDALKFLDFDDIQREYEASRCIVSLPPNWSQEWCIEGHPESARHRMKDAVEQTKPRCHALTMPDITSVLAMVLCDAKTVGRFSQVCREWRAAGMCSNVWSRLNDSRWPPSKTKTNLLAASVLLNQVFTGVSPRTLFRRRLESERARSGTTEAQLCNYAWAVELTELKEGTSVPVCHYSAVVQKDSANKATFDEFPDIFLTKLPIPIQDLFDMRDKLRATVQLIHVPTVTFVRIACGSSFGTAGGDSDANVCEDQKSFSATWPLPSIQEEEWLPKPSEIGVQLELDGSDPGLNDSATMLACRLTVDGDEPTPGEFLRAAAAFF